MTRSVFADVCLSSLEKRARRLTPSQMHDSAVVVSPHYDDETLGVGGTIIQKRKHGGVVYLVFMTDGSRSHASAMDGTRLSALRKVEALDAALALGVDAAHVSFLNFPETRLAEHTLQAADRVAQVLSKLRCSQVFVPSTLEPPIWSADHNATTEIVFRALGRTGQEPDIMEYPVWFWYHWPWVPVRRGDDARQLLKLTCQYWLRLSAWRNLNTAIDITDVQSQKRIALEKYASQMTRLSVEHPWPVLADVGNGEFLKRFFQPLELFNSYKFKSYKFGGGPMVPPKVYVSHQGR